MIDDLHHIVRMHLHDDVLWSFDDSGAIVLQADVAGGSAAERVDELCSRLGFEALGAGRWCVAASSPHYEDLWVYVEQDRIDSEDG